jgi:hypothetical protein
MTFSAGDGAVISAGTSPGITGGRIPVTVVYRAAGTYTVTATVTDDVGDSASATTTVIVD